MKSALAICLLIVSGCTIFDADHPPCPSNAPPAPLPPGPPGTGDPSDPGDYGASGDRYRKLQDGTVCLCGTYEIGCHETPEGHTMRRGKESARCTRCRHLRRWTARRSPCVAGHAITESSFGRTVQRRGTTGFREDKATERPTWRTSVIAPSGQTRTSRISARTATQLRCRSYVVKAPPCGAYSSASSGHSSRRQLAHSLRPSSHAGSHCPHGDVSITVNGQPAHVSITIVHNVISLARIAHLRRKA
jgi:hypothetical protein